VYVSGAKAAIRAIGLEFSLVCSQYDLLNSIQRNSHLIRKARIAPFLDFLANRQLKKSIPKEDITGLQNWVIQTIVKQKRSQKNRNSSAAGSHAMTWRKNLVDGTAALRAAGQDLGSSSGNCSG
jgi:hypothetical protein